MHHGTCVTHVPWCMSGSLTCGDRENVPGIPGACAPAILRIWQEAHALTSIYKNKHGYNYLYMCWCYSIVYIGKMALNGQQRYIQQSGIITFAQHNWTFCKSLYVSVLTGGLGQKDTVWLEHYNQFVIAEMQAAFPLNKALSCIGS